ncbi:MAG: PaxA [Deltaproteobacteria bacterium]|nr:PaxA [Deltaproteobacteria bacterium]
MFAAIKSTAPVEQEIQVKFIGPGNQPGPPPPPPPPAGPRHVKRKVTQPKQEIIRPVEVPKEIPKEVPKEPDVEVKEDGKEGGVEGGKEGGVIGGVVGGVVGGTGGGGTAAPPPPPPEKPKAKNVPPFVIARDMIRQPMPRLSEVFKQAHRGETLTGVYKVCVGQDGHVYEVNIIKSVPGADEEIVEGVKADWLYKEQQVPVCFIYSMPISIVQ